MADASLLHDNVKDEGSAATVMRAARRASENSTANHSVNAMMESTARLPTTTAATTTTTSIAATEAAAVSSAPSRGSIEAETDRDRINALANEIASLKAQNTEVMAEMRTLAEAFRRDVSPRRGGLVEEDMLTIGNLQWSINEGGGSYRRATQTSFTDDALFSPPGPFTHLLPPHPQHGPQQQLQQQQQQQQQQQHLQAVESYAKAPSPPRTALPQLTTYPVFTSPPMPPNAEDINTRWKEVSSGGGSSSSIARPTHSIGGGGGGGGGSAALRLTGSASNALSTNTMSGSRGLITHPSSSLLSPDQTCTTAPTHAVGQRQQHLCQRSSFTSDCEGSVSAFKAAAAAATGSPAGASASLPITALGSRAGGGGRLRQLSQVKVVSPTHTTQAEKNGEHGAVVETVLAIPSASAMPAATAAHAKTGGSAASSDPLTGTPNSIAADGGIASLPTTPAASTGEVDVGEGAADHRGCGLEKSTVVLPTSQLKAKLKNSPAIILSFSSNTLTDAPSPTTTVATPGTAAMSSVTVHGTTPTEEAARQNRTATSSSEPSAKGTAAEAVHLPLVDSCSHASVSALSSSSPDGTPQPQPSNGGGRCEASGGDSSSQQHMNSSKGSHNEQENSNSAGVSSSAGRGSAPAEMQRHGLATRVRGGRRASPTPSSSSSRGGGERRKRIVQGPGHRSHKNTGSSGVGGNLRRRTSYQQSRGDTTEKDLLDVLFDECRSPRPSIAARAPSTLSPVSGILPPENLLAELHRQRSISSSGEKSESGSDNDGDEVGDSVQQGSPSMPARPKQEQQQQQQQQQHTASPAMVQCISSCIASMDQEAINKELFQQVLVLAGRVTQYTKQLREMVVIMYKERQKRRRQQVRCCEHQRELQRLRDRLSAMGLYEGRSKSRRVSATYDGDNDDDDVNEDDSHFHLNSGSSSVCTGRFAEAASRQNSRSAAGRTPSLSSMSSVFSTRWRNHSQRGADASLRRRAHRGPGQTVLSHTQLPAEHSPLRHATAHGNDTTVDSHVGESVVGDASTSVSCNVAPSQADLISPPGNEVSTTATVHTAPAPTQQQSMTLSSTFCDAPTHTFGESGECVMQLPPLASALVVAASSQATPLLASSPSKATPLSPATPLATATSTTTANARTASVVHECAIPCAGMASALLSMPANGIASGVSLLSFEQQQQQQQHGVEGQPAHRFMPVLTLPRSVASATWSVMNISEWPSATLVTPSSASPPEGLFTSTQEATASATPAATSLETERKTGLCSGEVDRNANSISTPFVSAIVVKAAMNTTECDSSGVAAAAAAHQKASAADNTEAATRGGAKRSIICTSSPSPTSAPPTSATKRRSLVRGRRLSTTAAALSETNASVNTASDTQTRRPPLPPPIELDSTASCGFSVSPKSTQRRRSTSSSLLLSPTHHTTLPSPSSAAGAAANARLPRRASFGKASTSCAEGSAGESTLACTASARRLHEALRRSKTKNRPAECGSGDGPSASSPPLAPASSATAIAAAARATGEASECASTTPTPTACTKLTATNSPLSSTETGSAASPHTLPRVVVHSTGAPPRTSVPSRPPRVQENASTPALAATLVEARALLATTRHNSSSSNGSRSAGTGSGGAVSVVQQPARPPCAPVQSSRSATPQMATVVARRLSTALPSPTAVQRRHTTPVPVVPERARMARTSAVALSCRPAPTAQPPAVTPATIAGTPKSEEARRRRGFAATPNPAAPPTASSILSPVSTTLPVRPSPLSPSKQTIGAAAAAAAGMAVAAARNPHAVVGPPGRTVRQRRGRRTRSMASRALMHRPSGSLTATGGNGSTSMVMDVLYVPNLSGSSPMTWDPARQVSIDGADHRAHATTHDKGTTSTADSADVGVATDNTEKPPASTDAEDDVSAAVLTAAEEMATLSAEKGARDGQPARLPSTDATATVREVAAAAAAAAPPVTQQRAFASLSEAVGTTLPSAAPPFNTPSKTPAASVCASHDRRPRLPLPPQLSVTTLSEFSLSMQHSSLVVGEEVEGAEEEVEAAATALEGQKSASATHPHLHQQQQQQQQRNQRPHPPRTQTLLRTAVAGNNRSYSCTDDHSLLSETSEEPGWSWRIDGRAVKQFSPPPPLEAVAIEVPYTTAHIATPPREADAIVKAVRARESKMCDQQVRRAHPHSPEGEVPSVADTDPGHDAMESCSGSRDHRTGSDVGEGERGEEGDGDGDLNSTHSFLYDATTPVSVLSNPLQRRGLLNNTRQQGAQPYALPRPTHHAFQPRRASTEVNQQNQQQHTIATSAPPHGVSPAGSPIARASADAVADISC